MNKVLIASGICLDSITARHPHSIHANRLLSPVEKGAVKGIVSAESFSNIFYILRKLANSERALEQIRNLRKLVNIGTLKSSTIDQTLQSAWHNFEDALQYYCAIENKGEPIITRNKSDFKRADLPVLTASECIRELE